eukprot:8998045-Ditylum_brightwellii.AAC.1
MHRYLSNNQWGERNGRSAINVLTLKAIAIETLHYTRANTSFTDCNAQACYDCIIAIMTGLAMHKVGLPLKVSKYFIKALKEMEYYMSMVYRLSDQTN